MESLQPREADLHPLAAASGCWKCGVNICPSSNCGKVQRRGRENRSYSGNCGDLTNGGRRYALLVDQLIGQHQVVVKTLKVTIAKSPAFLLRPFLRRQRGTDC